MEQNGASPVKSLASIVAAPTDIKSSRAPDFAQAFPNTSTFSSHATELSTTYHSITAPFFIQGPSFLQTSSLNPINLLPTPIRSTNSSPQKCPSSFFIPVPPPPITFQPHFDILGILFKHLLLSIPPPFSPTTSVLPSGSCSTSIPSLFYLTSCNTFITSSSTSLCFNAPHPPPQHSPPPHYTPPPQEAPLLHYTIDINCEEDWKLIMCANWVCTLQCGPSLFRNGYHLRFIVCLCSVLTAKIWKFINTRG